MTDSHNASAGIPSIRREASSEISSLSVDELLTEPCFLQNHEIGTNVFGPMSTMKQPDVLLLSPNQEAKDASAKSAIWMSFGRSPTQHCNSKSAVKCM